MKKISAHQSKKGQDFMALIYFWFALIGVLVLMLFIKMIVSIAYVGTGRLANWSGYNAMLWVLAALAFFPLMVLYAVMKNSK